MSEENDQPVDITAAKRKAARDERKAQKLVNDSFQNLAYKMGVGGDDPLTSSTYGFNPITRVRTLLEWVHRGSFLGGIAVDVVADDMTRGGVTHKGEMDPADIEQLEETATMYGVWTSIAETIQWSRLYGGCLAVIMIDGQDPSTELRVDTIKKEQFRGLLVLDRWMVEPTLQQLVKEPGPNYGLPMYYHVTPMAPGMAGQKIHYSRCLRLIGIKLPYWQATMENLWGISVLERLYDRMIAFDSATTGAAQLVYKSYLRTLKVEGFRELVAAGGDALNGFVQYADMMRRFQSIEGITVIDGNDEFQVDGHSAFSGLSDALSQFGQQIAGALQIPLVRLFGQSPSGFSSGDTDLRSYYDTIRQRQVRDLKVMVTKIYRIIAASEGIQLPDGYSIDFNSLWQMSDSEKAQTANTVVDAVSKAEEAGLIDMGTAKKELRQSSNVTGIFSNITEEEIEEAIKNPPPSASEVEVPEEGETPSEEEKQEEPAKANDHWFKRWLRKVN